jgi:hypothetical protein
MIQSAITLCWRKLSASPINNPVNNFRLLPALQITHGDLTRKNWCGKLVTGVVNWKSDPLPMTFE